MSWPRLETKIRGPTMILSTQRTCDRDATSTRRCGRSGKATPSRELMSLRRCNDAYNKKAGLWERQILMLWCLVFCLFFLRRGDCMTFNKCSLNPEVFESPFYSIPSVRFGVVKNLYH